MRRTVSALFSSVMFAGLLATTLFASGCEDKAIGRPCEIPGDQSGSSASGAANNEALECPSRICILPAANTASKPDTTALCSASCDSDSDCDEGQSRDTGDKNDKRCRKGWKCVVPFETGPLCCRKLCECQDFLPVGEVTTSDLPKSCDKSVSSCGNL